mmetsp:Transcript_1600/g.1375  ORF Transcript_1600/g.1375 Transcript_1600/m.1375 type:complete len:473 (-) Transcript_1600:607-2025(-)
MTARRSLLALLDKAGKSLGMRNRVPALWQVNCRHFSSPPLTEVGKGNSLGSWDQPRIALLAEIRNEPGALHDLLKPFQDFNINLNRIESRPSNKGEDTFEMALDFNGDIQHLHVQNFIEELKRRASNMLVLDQREVPWFPVHVSELDGIANRTLELGSDLASDHPGAHDSAYRTRRMMLADLANSHRFGREIPHIEYTPEELATWAVIWNKLQPLAHRYACKEYLEILEDMRDECAFRHDNIPQQADISRYLHRKTGWSMRPVSGLLSSRDFLNGLAFRVFFSTQYIRHESMPLYTPEPDICHELLGHAPMFADPAFAQFSQEIGLASLGASDDDVQRLATCYWFSVEFGLCQQQGEIKAYGAGLLSSFGELEYACSKHRPGGGRDDFPQIKDWDPYRASSQTYPITDYQPVYFCADSLDDAKIKMRDFCEFGLKRPFHARYHSLTQSIWVDRNVSRCPSSHVANHDNGHER